MGSRSGLVGADEDGVVCRAVVLGDPLPKERPRLGRDGRTYTPSTTRAAQDAFAYRLKSGRRGCWPVEAPVGVRLSFHTRTRVHGDVDNLVKLALDAANTVVWVDDRQVTRLEAEVVDRADRPRVEFATWSSPTFLPPLTALPGLLCTAVIPGNPLPKERPRTGSGGRTYIPTATRQAEEALGWQLRRARRGLGPAGGPVGVRLSFHTRNRVRGDVDNLVKLALDAANTVVWVDDRQVTRLEAEVVEGADRPRVEFAAWELEGDR